jgi:hypothetical protein
MVIDETDKKLSCPANTNPGRLQGCCHGQHCYFALASRCEPQVLLDSGTIYRYSSRALSYSLLPRKRCNINLSSVVMDPLFSKVTDGLRRPVYEGANFLTLGRILYYIPYHSPIHPGRVFTTFVAMGTLIETITANGASRVVRGGSSESEQNVGHILLKVALILQIALMVGFIALALRFMYNCSQAGLLNKKVKRPLIVLLASCTLITIRTIYRTVEYFTVTSLSATTTNISPILKDEWFFWVFETTLMFSNTTLLSIFHPMQRLPRSNKIYLAPDGVTEVEGPGYQDRRPFLLTVFDPFDFTRLIMRKKDVRYWEAAPETTTHATVKETTSRTPEPGVNV